MLWFRAGFGFEVIDSRVIDCDLEGSRSQNTVMGRASILSFKMSKIDVSEYSREEGSLDGLSDVDLVTFPFNDLDPHQVRYRLEDMEYKFFEVGSLDQEPGGVGGAIYVSGFAVYFSRNMS
ncbi:hypothetical protein N7495_005290 [Penicillium taxi]|uniref:uncharacterized protein n=1 Tax=Penicillium taxi TaxID=168475 RepID=UPI00254504DC|nr:uncharacterized protein N7495_005290 [Penicillium taxi]KAJ5893599.1 hypothetical protein N7495_005290 [Penicillium taxi]